jgi:signal peptidase I
MKVAGTTYHDIEITDGEVERIIKSTLARMIGVPSPAHGFGYSITDGDLIQYEDYRGHIQKTKLRVARNEDRVVIKVFEMLDDVTKAKRARK